VRSGRAKIRFRLSLGLSVTCFGRSREFRFGLRLDF
jgi:hypothetical protein